MLLLNLLLLVIITKLCNLKTITNKKDRGLIVLEDLKIYMHLLYT